MRCFVVFGREATASGDFLLDDLPGTSGRVDVGLRCVRAALLVSHGLRRDVDVYLVLCKGEAGPVTVRFRGADAQFLRPDERSLAVLLKKVLAVAVPGAAQFVDVRPGVALARGGLHAVVRDLGPVDLYVLEEAGADVRSVADLGARDSAFFLGGPTGFDPETRAALAALEARPLSVGPIAIHAEDAVAIVSNEFDRRAAAT